MHGADTGEAASNAAMLMYRFQQRCQAIEQQQQALADDLKLLTQQLPLVVRTAVEDSLRQLPKDVREKIDSALHQTVLEYRQRYELAGREVGQGAQHLNQEMGRIERIHRMLVWKAVGVTAACLALLLAGGAWLSMHYAGVIRDNQISAETLRTYNAADLVLCDGRLCANVDMRGKRYGTHGEFVPVKTREVQSSAD
jgi:ElaB/YqjD/DUF883 family membrane-anchored ribosome-binding protein